MWATLLRFVDHAPGLPILGPRCLIDVCIAAPLRSYTEPDAKQHCRMPDRTENAVPIHHQTPTGAVDS